MANIRLYTYRRLRNMDTTPLKKQGNAVRDLQESYTENGDLQGVPERNTNGNNIGTIRPQQTTSSGQRDSV